MLTNTAVTTLPDLDLLQHVAVRVPCEACGQFYSVSLRQVLLSQQTLHLGCPGDGECPPLTYAALANETALHDLEQSWSRVLRDIRMLGLEITVTRPLLSN